MIQILWVRYISYVVCSFIFMHLTTIPLTFMCVAEVLNSL